MHRTAAARDRNGQGATPLCTPIISLLIGQKRQLRDSLYQLAFEDVPQGYPREEALQRLESAVQQRRLLAVGQDVLAKLVDLGEFLGIAGGRARGVGGNWSRATAR